MIGLPEPVKVVVVPPPEGVALTVYKVIALPPSEAGAVNATVNVPSPVETDIFCGAEGVVAGITEPADIVVLPAGLVAVTEISYEMPF